MSSWVLSDFLSIQPDSLENARNVLIQAPNIHAVRFFLPFRTVILEHVRTKDRPKCSKNTAQMIILFHFDGIAFLARKFCFVRRIMEAMNCRCSFLLFASNIFSRWFWQIIRPNLFLIVWKSVQVPLYTYILGLYVQILNQFNGYVITAYIGN